MRSDSLTFKALEFYGTRVHHPGQWRIHGWLRGRLHADVAEDLQVTRGGVRWVLNPADYVQRELFWLGEYDRWDSYHLLTFTRPGCTFVDAGANFGYYSIKVAQHLGGNCRVFAFEPFPANLARLRRNVGLNPALAGAITAVPMGLSDQRTELRMSTLSDNSGAARLGEDGACPVQLCRLDDFCREQDVTSIQAMKIDVEGHEVRVLRGAESVLRSMRPVLLVELMGDGLRCAGSSNKELIGWLRDLGYELHVAHRERLRPLEHVPQDNELLNAFCIPR